MSARTSSKRAPAPITTQRTSGRAAAHRVDDRRQHADAVPRAEGAHEADRGRLLAAQPRAPLRGLQRARRRQPRDVDPVGVDEHAIRRDAVAHQLVPEHLRHDDDERRVVDVAPLEGGEHVGEGHVPGAPLALGPDLRAVELEDERDAEAAGELEARERAQRVALVDRVGRRAGGRGVHLLARVVDQRRPVDELEDAPRRHLLDADAVDAVGALCGHDVHRDALVHEAVDDARGVRGGAADVRAEVAQRGLAAQVGDRADLAAGPAREVVLAFGRRRGPPARRRHARDLGRERCREPRGRPAQHGRGAEDDRVALGDDLEARRARERREPHRARLHAVQRAPVAHHAHGVPPPAAQEPAQLARGADQRRELLDADDRVAVVRWERRRVEPHVDGQPHAGGRD